jgi:hypothetical protein
MSMQRPSCEQFFQLHISNPMLFILVLTKVIIYKNGILQ